jgi:hypothetical protein
MSLRCRLITSVQELEAIRTIWESLQWHPNADIDFYLTIIDVRDEVIRPHVILVENNDKAVALVVGRLERVDFDLKFGYKSIHLSKVKQIAMVYGGLMGDCSEPVARIVIDSLLNSLRCGHADLVLFEFVRTDSQFYRVIRSVPFICRDFFFEHYNHFNLKMETSDDIFSRMSSKHRSELRRLPKFLQKQHPIRVERYTSIEDVSRLCDSAELVMTGTYQRGLGAGFIKSTENIRRMELSARKRWLLAYVLYVADKPCAFWIGALYRNSFFLEFTGYDLAFRKYEPGTILLDHMIRDLSSSYPHVRNMDYSFGAGFYKQRFSNDSWCESCLRIAAPNVKGCCLNFMSMANGLVKKLAISVLQRGGVQRLRSAWRKRLHS